VLSNMHDRQQSSSLSTDYTDYTDD